MSIIVRNNPSTGVGGSTPTGFPPGDVSNITYRLDNQKIQIKWTDPDDTIIDGITIAKWKGTLLVRNSDHYPNSIKDGDIVIDNTIRNKYKDNYYEDIGLVNNTTYYYRFFTYTEDKVYNDSGNLVFKAKPLAFNPVLKDNTWKQIADASESNSIPSTWKIGDEIDIALSGDFNETVTLQIWDFKHFDKSDESGKAGILFGMKHLMKDVQQMQKDSNYTEGGWAYHSYIRSTIIPKIYNSMIPELKNAIKEVNIYTSYGYGYVVEYDGTLSKDKIFIPGFTESYSDSSFSDHFITEKGQKKIPIFTDDKSRIKKLDNGKHPDESNSNYINTWWTRSPYYKYSEEYCYFNNLGKPGIVYDTHFYLDPTDVSGVCFCFNI